MGKVGDDEVKLPRKRDFRMRAHCNPHADNVLYPHPVGPDAVRWEEEFPEVFASVEKKNSNDNDKDGESKREGGFRGEKIVRFADIGCGFGGMLVALAKHYPDVLCVGMEIRDKYLTNYFFKGQLHKLFFLFPDPHFKEKNHRRRIITRTLLAEYAYVLAPGGMLYTITDVKELGDWMDRHCREHPLFEKVPEDELEHDVAAGLLFSSSEESHKVARNGGDMYRHVFRRK